MRNKDRDIWESAAWASRRVEYHGHQNWYDGKPLLARDKTKSDRNTGGKQRLFPLNIRLSKLSCDLHRDLARGIPTHDDSLVIRTSIKRTGDNDRASELETIINEKVWDKAHGGAIQQEALLAANTYGGTVFKLSWEPRNVDLPYRLAPRLIKNPGNINPVFDLYDPWRLLQCHVGYMISPQVAKAKYGVTPENGREEVLYLEYWDKERWWVHVDGVIPTITDSDGSEYKLEGPNPYGFVPVYYIPHERTTRVLGDAQTEGQTDLEIEVNARVTNITDIIGNIKSSVWFGHDIGRNLRVVKIVDEGKIIGRFIDGGNSRNIQGAHAPNMKTVPSADISDALIGFPDTLISYWEMLNRISPVVFGQDDTSSGRITGPVTAQRMWTSMAHCTTERINFSTAKNVIDRDILRILNVHNDNLAQMGIEPPDITSDDIEVDMQQRWHPMIPIDRTSKNEELINRFRDHGISPETFLTAYGERDIAGEKDRIRDWAEWQAGLGAVNANPDTDPTE